jgi:hypothetical protein
LQQIFFGAVYAHNGKPMQGKIDLKKFFKKRESDFTMESDLVELTSETKNSGQFRD